MKTFNRPNFCLLLVDPAADIAPHSHAAFESAMGEDLPSIRAATG